MATTVRSRDVARRATVRVCDRQGTHFGQGLLLTIEGEGSVVLTCHHVVASLGRDDLSVAIPLSSGELGQPVAATYDRQRSRPQTDAVVLRLREPGPSDTPSEIPLLHALNAGAYGGTLPDRAVCLGHWKTDSFDARVASTTRLSLPVETRGRWPDAPSRYEVPDAFRLAEPSDARPGISGSVVLYEDGVLGLAHFSRPAGPDQAREVYLVPLSTWAGGWPALAALIEPLVDGRLRNAATVKHARSLEVGSDVVIAGYRPDVYVEPAALQKARSALATRGGVVIIGRPKSGKTRLAWQLLREMPGTAVVIPHDPRPPNLFETSGLVGQDVVLLFDDLHRTALSIDPLEWRRRLEAATGKRCLLICASRDGQDWKQVEASGASGILDVLGREALVFTSQVGADGADLSKTDGLKLAKALGIARPEFVRRFDGTPGSLTLDLAEMRRRYLRLRDEQRAGISMSRLLDAAKLVYEASQPRLRAAVLRKVTEDIRGEGRLSAESWDTLLRRTDEEGFGRVDADSGDFRTYRPYLEECVAYQPASEEIERLVEVLIRANDVDGLRHLGQALFMRYNALPAAERALRAALDAGDKSAATMLGWVLGSIPDREAEAEAFYRSQIDHGEPAEYIHLGNLLAHLPGREADAEQAYRDGIKTLTDRGTQALAHWSLGNLLVRQPGRENEVEAAFRAARDAGLFMAHHSLAEFLSRIPGRESEAEQVIAEAINAIQGEYERLGPADQEGAKSPAQPAEHWLEESRGQLLLLRGIVLGREDARQADAERALNEAINAGNRIAFNTLGALLANQAGREKDAEQAFREAVSAGVDEAEANLRRFLAGQPGREAEAEALIRKAIDAGDKRANFELAVLLVDEPARGADAETALREAISAGVSDAHLWLGYLLERQAGREREAEEAYRTAVNLGIAEARMRLGSLLSRQAARMADAEAVYREAINDGDRSAYQGLGRLLVARVLNNEPGFADEAEKLLRAAIDAGESDAAVPLSVVLVNQPERQAEAYSLLKDAAAAGIDGAAELLKFFDEPTPNQGGHPRKGRRKGMKGKRALRKPALRRSSGPGETRRGAVRRKRKAT